MDTLYIVMPAYNEEENIKAVIEQWYPILKQAANNSKLVVADSGSSDSTHMILLAMQKKYENLVVLSDTGKQHGPKLIALYDYAIKSGADYIFQTDSDGQTNPDEFLGFWNLRERYDVILGHRQVRGDGKVRALVEWVVCFLIKLYFGVKVPDANAPFRLMKAEIVKKYLHKLPVDYNLPNIMLTTFFSYYSERLQFLIITFKSRQAGVNSIDIPKIIKIGWKALNDFQYFRKTMTK